MKKLIWLFLATLFSCNSLQRSSPSPDEIKAMHLKQGDVIWCGPPMANFGSVEFMLSADTSVKNEFQQAIAMLHSFEYDEAEKAFAAVIEKDPSCSMAYWGVAMSNFHPLWEPPSQYDLQKGDKAIRIAQSISRKTQRESDYINAIAQFYDDWQHTDHKTRCLRYEAAMEKNYRKYPQDDEAAIFYALALNTTADPADKTYKNQKVAGAILNKLAEAHPEHPGIIHYIIHNYDNPDLAKIALPAARKYASVAPASAHAQHMPSHIFVRLGLWDEAISSNLASINSAKCYAEKASLSGNFDEELHGLDYLMYAYLQKGDNTKAKEQLNYLRSIEHVSAQNVKVAYAFAAMPARYLLENKKWNEAASLKPFPASFPWHKFPWQNAITVYTRLLGKVHTNDIKGAQQELNTLKKLQQSLLDQKDLYKAKQIEVQIKSGAAWIAFNGGNTAEAERLMREAADLEDGTMKHPVTPGEVLPTREQLGDLLLEMRKPDLALIAYREDLNRHANRLNGLKGMRLATQIAARK